MEIFAPPHLKTKNPRGRRSKHTEAYQEMVAKKVAGGTSYREAGKTFGLSHGSIANILKKYAAGKFNERRRETTAKYKSEVETYRHQKQINDLKLEVADLYLENLMLKKMLEHSLRKKNESSSDITSENLDLLQANTVTGDFHAVSLNLGHSSVEETKRYVEEVSDGKRKVARALNDVAVLDLKGRHDPLRPTDEKAVAGRVSESFSFLNQITDLGDF